MRSEKLSDAIGMIDDDILEEADNMRNNTPNKKSHRTPLWTGLAATAACAVIIGGVLLTKQDVTPPVVSDSDSVSKPDSNVSIEDVLPVGAIALADIPDYIQPPDYYDYEDWDAYEAANTEYQIKHNEFHSYDKNYSYSMEGFFNESIRTYLTNANGDNTVISPINLYIALATLSETTDGNTRQQLLDALGAEDIGQLRTITNALWKDNYIDSDIAANITANSLWLDDTLPYKEETLQAIAQHYYASSYHGDIGSMEMNIQLQKWLNENTGGLLSEQAEKVELDKQALFAIASTVYFEARWQEEFSKSKTKEGIFHSADGDITCDFLNSKLMKNVYVGEVFSAIELKFDNINNEGGSMWIILPDEGVAAEKLADNDELYEFLSHIYGKKTREWSKTSNYIEVNISLPKFDVVSDIDLRDGMKAMGITDIFDGSKADFSAMLDENETLDGSLGYAQHAARVTIDEEGCTAAAYTVIQPDGAAMPGDEPCDFIVDRPFMFVLTNDDDLPLFSGIVNVPNA